MKTPKKAQKAIKKTNPKEPDPMVPFSVSYREARAYRNSILKYLVGTELYDPLPKVLWKHSSDGYDTLEKFVLQLNKQLTLKWNEFERTPDKKITIKMCSSLMKKVHLALYTYLKQPGTDNNISQLMKKYDPDAFKNLQSLLKKSELFN